MIGRVRITDRPVSAGPASWLRAGAPACPVRTRRGGQLRRVGCFSCRSGRRRQLRARWLATFPSAAAVPSLVDRAGRQASGGLTSAARRDPQRARGSQHPADGLGSGRRAQRPAPASRTRHGPACLAARDRERVGWRRSMGKRGAGPGRAAAARVGGEAVERRSCVRPRRPSRWPARRSRNAGS